MNEVESVEAASIEDMIRQLHDFREQKRALESEIKAINVVQRDVEIQLIETMQSAGISKCSADGIGTVSVKEQEVANLKDFEALAHWIAESPVERISIFQKRVSAKAFDDFAQCETSGNVPGIDRATITKVNLRSAR